MIYVYPPITFSCRKMVNVNAPLPFNLHNKLAHGHHDASSSRSGTRSRSAHPVMGGLVESSTDMLPDLPSRISSYSPTRGRDLSPSLPTSRSTSSLQPGDASYLPPEADPEGGNKKPILNMRLVRGTGGYGVGGTFRPRNGRNVTRGRVGPFSDHAEPDTSERDGDGTSGNTTGSSNEHDVGQSSQEPSRNPAGTEVAIPLAAEPTLTDVGRITCSWGD